MDRVVIPLRVLLVLLFAGLLVGQVMSVPGQFSHMAQEAPELGNWPWVLMSFFIVELVFVQVVIVCTWKLLTMVRAGRIFSEEAFAWVDTIVWTMTAAWVLMAGVFASLTAYIYFTPELRDPGLPILMFGTTLVGGVVVLTVVVMRALLRQATVLRTDMEAVI